MYYLLTINTTRPVVYYILETCGINCYNQSCSIPITITPVLNLKLLIVKQAMINE